MPWLGYSRVSKVGERGDRLLSPELQHARIEEYAKTHGIQVEMLDPELDVSGGTLKRPVLSAALERIDRGEAEGIIVAQLDRLSRAGIHDTLPVLKRVEEAGGAVIAVAEDFDTTTPEGRMARNVMLSLGEMQREQRGRGFEQARRSAVDRGIWVGGHVPVGYSKSESRRLERGVDAQRVLDAFEARAAGQSWKRVAAILGVSESGAQYAIRNRAYLGEVGMTIGGESVVNPLAHPALVNRALWESAQLQHPRPPRGRGGPALLAGLIRCAGCQRLMSPTRRAYNCTSKCEARASIDRSLVEPFVVEVVLGHLEALRFAGESRGDALGAAMDRLADAEAELKAFQAATSASGVGVEAFAEGLRSRVDAVEVARAEVGRTRTTDRAEVAGIVDLWHGWDVSEQGQVLRGLLDVVWVRSARRRSLPVTERVKIVEAGFGPPDLSRQGVRGPALEPLVWEAVPGEVAPIEVGEND